MISTKPGSPAHRAMSLLAQTPGMTSDEIAAELYPVNLPRPAYNVRHPSAVTAWREELGALQKAAGARASRLVGRLQEQGIVETRGAPRLSDGFRAEVATTTARLLLEWPRLRESLDQLAPLTPARADEIAVEKSLRRRTRPREGLAWLSRIVAALRVENPPGSARALFASMPSEKGGKAGGAANRAYRRLDQIGALIPPSQRYLTPAGIALLGQKDAA